MIIARFLLPTAGLAKIAYQCTKVFEVPKNECLALFTAWHSEQNILAANFGNNSVIALDVDKGEEVTAEHQEWTSSIDWYSIYDAFGGILRLNNHKRTIDLCTSMCHPHNKNIIAIPCEDKTISIVNFGDGKKDKPTCIAVLTGHEDHVLRVVWDKHGNRLISFSLDNTIKIWEVVALEKKEKKELCSLLKQTMEHKLFATLVFYFCQQMAYASAKVKLTKKAVFLYIS